MLYFREKESKLIKLLLAVKDTGVDLEKIFQKTIINEELPKKKKRRREEKEEGGNLTIEYYHRKTQNNQSVLPLLSKSMSM